MGNHQLAINDFNEAIKHDPDLSEGYYRRGLSKFQSKRFKEAIEDFENSKEKENILLDEDPQLEQNAGIPDGLGQCYHALRNYDKAIQYYDTAIDMMPDNTEFLMHRAQCHYDQNNYEASNADLMQGLKQGNRGANDP